MKKRMIAWLLTLAMVLSLMPTMAFAANSGKCGDNLTWTLRNGVLTISGKGAMYDGDDLDLPAWYEAIDRVKTVIIGNGVTNIGENAFASYTGLTSVTIPNSVTRINNGSFACCWALTHITIPDSVTSIGDMAFYQCGLYSVTIPNRVTSIGAQAFEGDGRMTSVTIPASVTSIGQWAFGYKDGFGIIHEKIPGFTIYGYPGTAAQTYANNNGFKFIPLANTPFYDVLASDYYAGAVSWAVKKGVTAGKDDTHFAPNDPCTRAQIVSFLWRAYGSPKPSTKTNPFVDVKPSDYFYDAVLWAVEKGITAGKDTTHFAPNEACTRAQAVSFQYRAAKSPAVSASSKFRDVASNAYYAGAVAWAVSRGITAGTTDATFSPDLPCTRAQIVSFLHRQLG